MMPERGLNLAIRDHEVHKRLNIFKFDVGIYMSREQLVFSDQFMKVCVIGSGPIGATFARLLVHLKKTRCFSMQLLETIWSAK